MSKKLEALETLKLLKDFVLENNKNGLDRRFIIGSCDILEQELKEYEDLKEEYKSLLELSKQTTKECPIYDPYQDSNSPEPSYTSLIKKESYLAPYFRDVEKELKALEIIKKTVMKLVSLEDDTTICLKGRYAVYDSELFNSIDLTKEEYDLLKEVCYEL